MGSGRKVLQRKGTFSLCRYGAADKLSGQFWSRSRCLRWKKYLEALSTKQNFCILVRCKGSGMFVLKNHLCQFNF